MSIKNGGITLDRVEAGSQEQLARWTLAVLTANTPEEVFRLQ